MTGARLKQPEATRPAEVIVPRLSEEEVRKRATAGFDAAMANVIRQKFSQPPPAAELAALRREIEPRLKNGENVDIGDVIGAYADKNPNSTIARYLQATGGATDWMLLPGGRLGFNAKVFQAYIRETLGAAKQPYVNAIAQLSDPENRSSQIDASNILARANVVPELSTQLHAQCNQGRNALPVIVACDSAGGSLILTSKLPPPNQNMDFRKG